MSGPADTDVELNALGQPVGRVVPGWRPPSAPTAAALAGGLRGRYCRLEPLRPEHADDLFAADARDTDGASWTYLPYGPWPDLPTYRAWVDGAAASTDPLFLAVVDTAGAGPVGVASYLRIHPDAGSVEVGHLHYSPLLQRRTAATEAQYLLMRHAVGTLGYRRYEWKCDALNAPSRAAAERLGFTYEGTFRQGAVVKGRNRDTAWFAVVDADWPALRAGFEAWLDPANFPDGPTGRPRRSLAACRARPDA
ncbi:MAG TPA: GNAT family protein [Pseudonocardia sp.]|jgi:RimJ/RimL family protein N-acetyltransferase